MLIENAFPEIRQPGDIDLIVEISNLLQSAGHPNPQMWQHHSSVTDAIDAHPKLQRFLINRYWRVRLGSCAESTTRERYCLVDTGDYATYLKIFKDAVLPSIIKYNL